MTSSPHSSDQTVADNTGRWQGPAVGGQSVSGPQSISPMQLQSMIPWNSALYETELFTSQLSVSSLSVCDVCAGVMRRHVVMWLLCHIKIKHFNNQWCWQTSRIEHSTLSFNHCLIFWSCTRASQYFSLTITKYLSLSLFTINWSICTQNKYFGSWIEIHI